VLVCSAPRTNVFTLPDACLANCPDNFVPNYLIKLLSFSAHSFFCHFQNRRAGAEGAIAEAVVEEYCDGMEDALKEWKAALNRFAMVFGDRLPYV
jgi:hypothetical protein